MNISGVRTTPTNIVVGFEVNGEQFEMSVSVKTLPQVAGLGLSDSVLMSAEPKPERKKPGPKPGIKRQVKKVKAEAAGPNGEHQPEQVA